MQIFAQVHLQCNALLHSSQCSMVDLGEGPGGPSPPPFLDQMEAQRAPKKFWRLPPLPYPLISGSGWQGPLIISRSESSTDVGVMMDICLRDKFDFRLNIFKMFNLKSNFSCKHQAGRQAGVLQEVNK